MHQHRQDVVTQPILKKLGRFSEQGHRVLARGEGRSHRVGWDFVHVAIDDATRLAYVEILPDEKQESAATFLKRALKGCGRATSAWSAS